MSSKHTLWTSSIGRKLIMGLSGLFLISFLVVHLSGNLLLFKNDGGIEFNEHTRFMTTNPLIKVAEWILFAGFIIHIAYAAILSYQNNKARPEKYAYAKGAAASSSWFSRNMGLSGTIVLIFLIVHLTMFWGMYKFGKGEEGIPIEKVYTEAWKVKDHYGPFNNAFGQQITIEKGQYLDEEHYELLKANNTTSIKASSMTNVVKRSFKEWYIVVFYVLAMLLLGFHLNHGFQSAFRTLGLVHKKYTPAIQLLGTIISIIFPLLFASMPLYYFFML